MATEIEKLTIQLELNNKQLNMALRQVDQRLKQTEKNTKRSFGAMNTALAGFRAGIGLLAAYVGFSVINNELGKLIGVGREIEDLGVRLKFLFGSTQEGSKAFQVMADYASEVPFTLQEIQQGAANLAAVTDSAADLEEMLKITGNAAAVAGLDFNTAATQIQRSFAAGANSADLFRERGVLAIAGFTTGVKVGTIETGKRFKETFGTGGTMDGATQELADNLTGVLSLITDKLFHFRKAIGQAGAFEVFKKGMAEINKALGENSLELETAAILISDALKPLAKLVTDFGLNLTNNVSRIAAAFNKIIDVIFNFGDAFKSVIEMYRQGLADAASQENFFTQFLPGSATIELKIFNSMSRATTSLLDGLGKAFEKTKKEITELADARAADARAIAIQNREMEKYNSVMDNNGTRTFIGMLKRAKPPSKDFAEAISDTIEKLKIQNGQLSESQYEMDKFINSLEMTDEEANTLRAALTSLNIVTARNKYITEEAAKAQEKQKKAAEELKETIDSLDRTVTLTNDPLSDQRQLIKDLIDFNRKLNSPVADVTAAIQQLTIELKNEEKQIYRTAHGLDALDAIVSSTVTSEEQLNFEFQKLNAEVAEFGDSRVPAASIALERLRDQIKGTKSDIELLTKAVEDGKSPQEQLREKIYDLEMALDRVGKDAVPGATEAIKRLKEELEASNPVLQQLQEVTKSNVNKIVDAFEEMAYKGKISFTSLRDMIKLFLVDIAKSMLQMMFFNKIKKAIFTGFGMPDSAIAAIPTMASGGTVQANVPQIVGERGPEMFVPNSSGRITNNMNTKNMTGGSTVVNQTINVSAGVVQTVRDEIANVLPQIRSQTMNAISEGRRRNTAMGAFG